MFKFKTRVAPLALLAVFTAFAPPQSVLSFQYFEPFSVFNSFLRCVCARACVHVKRWHAASQFVFVWHKTSRWYWPFHCEAAFKPMYDAIVIGGGVVGSAILRELCCHEGTRRLVALLFIEAPHTLWCR